jgi:hypothetical protein
MRWQLIDRLPLQLEIYCAWAGVPDTSVASGARMLCMQSICGCEWCGLIHDAILLQWHCTEECSFTECTSDEAYITVQRRGVHDMHDEASMPELQYDIVLTATVRSSRCASQGVVVALRAWQRSTSSRTIVLVVLATIVVVSLVLIALAIVIYNRSRRSVYQRAATNEPLGDIELDELTL